MSLPNDDNETLHALTPGMNASTASNADIPLLPPTPSPTVKTLLTHTFRWTVQAMGFQRLWVGGGEKKISAQES